MNEANQILSAIRRKKAIYVRMMKETDSINEGIAFKEVIDELSEEEQKWVDILVDDV